MILSSVFSRNSANSAGGAVYTTSISKPIFVEVTIFNNTVTGESSNGGGFYCDTQSNPVSFFGFGDLGVLVFEVYSNFQNFKILEFSNFL